MNTKVDGCAFVSRKYGERKRVLHKKSQVSGKRPALARLLTFRENTGRLRDLSALHGQVSRPLTKRRVSTSFANLVKEKPCLKTKILLGFSSKGKHLIFLSSYQNNENECQVVAEGNREYNGRLALVELWRFNLCKPTDVRFVCAAPILDGALNAQVLLNHSLDEDVCAAFQLFPRSASVAVTVSPTPLQSQFASTWISFELECFSFRYSVGSSMPPRPEKHHLPPGWDDAGQRILVIPMNSKLYFLSYKVTLECNPIPQSGDKSLELDAICNVKDTATTQEWWKPGNLSFKKVVLKFKRMSEQAASSGQEMGDIDCIKRIRSVVRPMKQQVFEVEEFLTDLLQKYPSLLYQEGKKLRISDYESDFVTFTSSTKCLICIIVYMHKDGISKLLELMIQLDVMNGDYSIKKHTFHNGALSKELKGLRRKICARERKLHSQLYKLSTELTNTRLFLNSTASTFKNPIDPVQITFK